VPRSASSHVHLCSRDKTHFLTVIRYDLYPNNTFAKACNPYLLA